MSERSQVLKVPLCVKIQKLQSLAQSVADQGQIESCQGSKKVEVMENANEEVVAQEMCMFHFFYPTNIVFCQ